MLNVIDIFKSIQGGGPATGEPAIFIRLAGCPVKCKWCDTEYIKGARAMTEGDILNKVNKLGSGIVVLTGGEPLVQDVSELIDAADRLCYSVHIETSGATECLQELPDVSSMVCSPKTEFLSPVAKYATAWKYIIGEGMLLSEDDGLPIGIARPLNSAPIFIQPLWNNIKITPVWPDKDSAIIATANNSLAVKIVLKYNYRLSLQTHKYLGI